MFKKQGTKPRVLVLSLTYLPYIGGAEVAVKEISSCLEGFFTFDILTSRLDRKLPRFEQVGNVGVYRVGIGHKTIDKYIFTFLGFFKALKLHFKNKYSIVWSIMAAYSSFSVLFRIFTKAKVVLTLQEGDPIEYIMKLKRFKIFLPVYKIYFRLVNKVTVISSFLGNWAEYLGVKKEKIVLIPNGVCLSAFATNCSCASADRRQDLKNKLGIKQNEKVILTVSRIVEKNGVEDLIKSINLLKNKNIKLLIVGDGELKNKLEKLVDELDLDNNTLLSSGQVQFLGEIDYNETQKYYSVTDVFCRPSLSEGFGNVFVEAMAAEIPVIATPVGGILDFLKDNETGWFCEVKNPQSIADKIKYILNEKNSNEVGKVVNNAKKMVKEKYSWDKVAEQMKKVFLNLLILSSCPECSGSG
ncbi:MAG: glycosyltransferase family 4 protein [Patescibacteria group bacterium]